MSKIKRLKRKVKSLEQRISQLEQLIIADSNSFVADCSQDLANELLSIDLGFGTELTEKTTKLQERV